MSKSQKSEHLKTGIWGEKIAVRFLKKRGYKILATRLKIKHDEIDIVAQKDDLLIFVEVKTRASENYGRAASAIGERKKRALQRGIYNYLKKLKINPQNIRIDCIEVIGTRPKKLREKIREYFNYEKTLTIRHIEKILTLNYYQLPQKKRRKHDH